MQENSKKILVELPGNDTLMGGLVSQITFENPDFRKGLNVMFNTSNREEIIAIKIESNSIRAYFQTK